mmetsp:Transcript_18872/g.38391  ORF Transcript_18872/g.38391 Transcript_18872/m.38391 type:complete len:153 (+) Transcript_18872:1020-1478(+)
MYVRMTQAGTNFKGPCIIICKTASGAVCGGYAPKGYAGYGEYRGSIAAFLFTWPDGDTSKPAIKLQKVGGAGLATIDEPETGPRFGADGLVIMMNPGTERMVTSKLGHAHMPTAYTHACEHVCEHEHTRAMPIHAYMHLHVHMSLYAYAWRA